MSLTKVSYSMITGAPVNTLDSGAIGNGVDDNTAAIQRALDEKRVVVTDGIFNISNALKVESLSSTVGQRPGIAFIGDTATVKSAITKTTNTTTAITNFQTGVVSNVDCLMYINPAWIDSGAAYPQKANIKTISFNGAAANPNDRGIYIEQGGAFTFSDLDFANINHAIWAKECWLTIVERVHAQSKFVWQGGTSVTFTDCWTGSGSGSTGGYDFASLIYSTMNSCGSDGATNTAYRFVNSKLTLNSCGCENASTVTANSGTAIAFDGGNEIVLNNFNVVPQVNQTIALFSINADETITFNQGTADFNVTGVNCPDFYVWGNNSIVTLNDYVSWNGTKDTPIIQFAVGVSTSKVVVNYTTPSGTNTKIYYSDGLGNTLSESFFDAGTFSPELSFGGLTTGITYTTRSGFWQKCGSILTIGGRVTLSSKGSATGAAALSGWPLFDPKGDASMEIPYIVNISSGPLFGVVDIAGAGSQGVFVTQSASGTVNATNANFTNTTAFWFTFTYSTNSVFI